VKIPPPSVFQDQADINNIPGWSERAIFKGFQNPVIMALLPCFREKKNQTNYTYTVFS